jgi:tetratricopeptide (TPR) repeat protein
MKFRNILTLCLAGVSMGAFAQTHVQGEEYFKADQFENAKDLLTRSLNNAGTDKSVRDYYLGMIAINENNTAEASKYFDAGVAANAQNPYNYVGQGLVKLMAGDQKGAEELFKQAEKLTKKDASLDIAIARAYDRVDPTRYEKQINKKVDNARKHNMQSPEIYIFEGDQAREIKDWGKAAGMYEMAKGYDPNATAAYVKYANLYTMVNPDYAIKMLNELLSVNPQSALGQRELANAYYNKKDYAKAATQYGAYVQNPSHFKSDENRYAFLLFYGQDYKKGYDYATKLLQEDPKNFTAQRYQFMNACQLPEMKDQLLPMAEALYAAHMKDAKNNKFAPIDFTLISSELSGAKRTDEAISVLQEGIKENPEFADFNKSLAFAYLDQNNLTKTADEYSVYLSKIEPGFNDYKQQGIFDFYAAVENKADAALVKKYLDAAKACADKASELNPDSYWPSKMYGDIAKQTAASEDAATSAAVADYEKAIGLLEASANPMAYKSDAKTMYMYLGNYYAGQKNTAKEKEYFQKALQYDPNNETLRKYVESL